MRCPLCEKRAIGFFSSRLSNPFAWFECESCGAELRLGLALRVMCALTMCVIGVSFCFTFPWMHKVIHGREDRAAELAFGAFLPYLVIPLQVVVLFIPLIVYARLRGRLETRMGKTGS